MLHLHLESFRRHPALFHLTGERWAAAARRLHVTLGWDGDIIDEALKTADIMINSSPPKDRLRERAPRLKWIQTTGAGVDSLVPLTWLPQDIALTNNSGAHGAKAEDSCTMALLMLNRARLDLLKPEAGIINIGRSPVIDYAALCDKLGKSELSGAVLDVFDQEPLPADSPLWTVPNLVITPHISCDDPRYIDMLFDRWFENFERFLIGRRLNNLVDRKLGY